jgi:hypothetical protein
MTQDLDRQFEAEIFRTLQAARADTRVPAWSQGPNRVRSAARRQRRLRTLASGLGAVVLLGGPLVGVVIANHQPRQLASGATGEEPSPGIATARPATPPYQDRMKPARVVTTGDPLSSDHAVTIDVGTRDGVHSNMTVVTDLGLVGNVVRVSETTATVQLLTDPASYVVVRDVRTNVTGFVSARADGKLNFTEISPTSAIRVGDQVVTKGSTDDQPYVPNIPVGEVISVDNTPDAATHTGVVQPYARFDALDLVQLIFPVAIIGSPPPSTGAPSTPAR